MSSFPLVTILVLNYNGEGVINNCINSVLKQTYPNFEIVIVDNCSTDDSFRTIATTFPSITLIKTSKNLGYAGGNNFGISYAKGDYVAFLNNDAYPEPDWLLKIMAIFSTFNLVSVVGCKIYQSQKMLLDSAGGYIDFPIGYAPGRGSGLLGRNIFTKTEELPYVGGAAFIVNKDVFQRLGGFDECYFCYHEEVDFCWRSRLMGYKVYYSPDAIVYHEISHSIGNRSTFKEYLMQRNRLFTNFKNLERKTLPLTIYYEFIYTTGRLLFYVLTRNEGLFIAYAKSFFSLIKNFKLFWKKRLRVQASRKVSDKEILKIHRSRNIAAYLKLMLAGCA